LQVYCELDSNKYPKRPKVNSKLTPFVPALLVSGTK